MAALLRSARLLKFSPSGLFKITRSKRNGSPLNHLYSGPVGSGRSGVCCRFTGRASENPCSRIWPYTVGYARNYVVASTQTDEASVAVQTKQMQLFDFALTKLDTSVRRTGRITKTLLYSVFHDIRRTGCPSSNQALLLLRSCGSLLAEVLPEQRTELAHSIWDKLQNMGVVYDVSHYNALLKVYLQNEFKFSPADFMEKMEAANVPPNRVTYQRLIAAYCQDGDTEGASTILGFMKTKGLPITEAVFNSLIKGHARSGDMESAKNILSVMRGAGMEPGPETYLTLVDAYAEKGDIENMKRTLEMADNAECTLTDRDLMEVIFTLAKTGHHQHIPDIVSRLRHESGYVPDAMNLCLSLITRGQEDAAFQILKTFPLPQSSSLNADASHQGNFFLRHCVNMGTSSEKIGHYCKTLQEMNMHPSPLLFSLRCALEANNTGLSLELMKMVKEQVMPIRPHFFWPLLTHHVKNRHAAGVMAVIKSMQKMEVYPDSEILSRFVFPVFSSTEEAQQALKDLGISPESEDFLSLHLRSLALSDLDQLYTTLSNPSFPQVPLILFRGSLIQSFKESSDVEIMAKITELLYRDQRFSTMESPAIETEYFLYQVVRSILQKRSDGDKDLLRNFFNQLQTKGIKISLNIFRGIRKNLESHQLPMLVEHAKALVNSEDLTLNAKSLDPTFTEPAKRKAFLVKKLAQLKAHNESVRSELKQAIHILCVEENLQGALELMRQYEEDMTANAYIDLITLCCQQNNMEEALNLKMKLRLMDTAMSHRQFLNLVSAFAMSGQVEEAIDFLKDMKEKEMTIDDSHIRLLFSILSIVANKNDPDVVRQLLDTIFALGLTKPTPNICNTLITAYLNREDLDGALEAALYCHKRYAFVPNLNNIFIELITKGDTKLLEKAMDFVTHVRGERAMLYDLFFAFLETGRYNEAQKIIETPGLRAVQGRLNWFAEKCIAAKKTEALEKMVEMTAKLFECDRDQMFRYLLQLYKNKNDWQKAEALWTKMQEENVVPRESTMSLLADILKANNKEVPFQLSETWYSQDAGKEESEPVKNVQLYQISILALCKKGKAKEAFESLKECQRKGIELSSSVHDHVIRSLLAHKFYDEAMEVRDIAKSHTPRFQLSDIACSLAIITLSKKGRTTEAMEYLMSMLKEDHMPTPLAVANLVQAFGSKGDLAGIQEVESLVQSFGMTSILPSIAFINNKALAHVKNGDLDAAVEVLEAVYTNPNTTHPSMAFVFRKLFEDGSDKAIDKLSAMAERLANQFACYRAAVDLFLEMVDLNKVEDARLLLERCKAVAEQKVPLISFVAKKSQKPGETEKVKNLLSLVPYSIDRKVQCQYLIKCYAVNNDLPSAKALYKQMLNEGVDAEELTLKRLATLYRDAGETAPFPEPPKSFKFYADKLKSKSVSRETTSEQ
ncbi:leucine-rich PPR motif-containing protein, mitochondrial [Thalassophryne amazonica]|uniref:leucine-rich PPR motif-containing protein, mitochondrial n=1 Tax=Thalassophryne amazonica TaxID=390379 RepID=UPI001470FFEA|nr:leucine-rich PPR motif-containing protein, mitochondrial [Thalassophryne amazonica]